MVAAGCARIIFSSTCATYGVPERVAHGRGPPAGADQPLRRRASAPSSACSATYARAGLLRAVALRYFNAAGCHPDGSLGEDHDPEDAPHPARDRRGAGPRARPSPSSATTTTRPTAPASATTSTCSDLARAHVLALEALDGRRAPSGSYNLGTETGTLGARGHGRGRARERAQGPATRSGPRRPGDPPRLVASAAKVRARARLRAGAPRPRRHRRDGAALAPRPSAGLRGRAMSRGRRTPLADPLPLGRDAGLQRDRPPSRR